MWLNKWKLSQWAFYFCRIHKDHDDIKILITTSQWAYNYCMKINDDPEVRKRIINKKWLYLYNVEKERKKSNE